MPVVNVGETIYEVGMRHEGDLNFKVTRANGIFWLNHDGSNDWQ